jgi:hypothetical protein
MLCVFHISITKVGYEQGKQQQLYSLQEYKEDSITLWRSRLWRSGGDSSFVACTATIAGVTLSDGQYDSFSYCWSKFFCCFYYSYKPQESVTVSMSMILRCINDDEATLLLLFFDGGGERAD